MIHARIGQRSFSRFTGDQNLPMGQYMLYRLRFALAGDLTDACADFGGLVAQLNLIALVTDMSIADHPGVAITYDRRVRRHIQKLAQKRASPADYFSILSAMQPDIKAAALRGFEYNTGLMRKEREAEKAKKEKPDAETNNQKKKNGRTTTGPSRKRRNGRNKRPRKKKGNQTRHRIKRRRSRI